MSSEAAAKLAKVVQASSSSFRERAREAYEERRAQGRLGAATQTCITLDEKAGQDVRACPRLRSHLLSPLFSV